MPKTDRPNRAQGRLITALLATGRTNPDGWLRDEREAVTRLHTWAHGAPPKLDPRTQAVGDPVHDAGPGPTVAFRVGDEPHAHEGDEPLDAQVGRLADWLIEHAPEAIADGGAVDCALRLLDAQQANLDALRAEVARLSGLLDEAGDRYESMRERRNRARDHAVTAEAERAELRARAVEAEREVHDLREQRDELTVERDAARRIVAAKLDAQADEPASPQPDRHPRALDDDPRRPHLGNSWPDDAVLLRYTELRNLVALHARVWGESVLSPEGYAQAVCDGEVPLRVSEVLDR